MKSEDWVKKIHSWLEIGKDTSRELVGLPWEVKEERMGETTIIVAQHPKVAFPIYIKIGGGFISLFIDLGIETDAMDVKDRMKIYKALLKINGQLNLFKVALGGEEENVISMVDLNMTSLSKEEFNDALTALLIGSHTVISALGYSEEFQKALMQRLLGMISERLSRGDSIEDVKNFLVNKVGMGEEEADELLKDIKETIEKKEGEERERTSHYIS